MNAIPNQRQSNDPQAVEVTFKVTVEIRVEAQRAELHVDLPDDAVRQLAVRAVYPADSR